MVFSYSSSCTDALRQGELLWGIYEVQPIVDGTRVDYEVSVGASVDKVLHPYSAVVTPDCDLYWDFKFRSGQAQEHKRLQHIWFCSLFTHEEIRDSRGLNYDHFVRVKENKNPRFHYFPEASVEGQTAGIPELFADFKYVFSMPAEYVHAIVSQHASMRLCLLVCPYLQDFVQRLTSFFGRVGVEDE